MVLRDVQLWHLDLTGLSWLEDGSLEQIVSACLGVNKLDVESSTNSHFTAVASLLRDPMSILTYIKIDHDQDDPDFDGTMALREIAESLVGNTRLKTINCLMTFRSMVLNRLTRLTISCVIHPLWRKSATPIIHLRKSSIWIKFQ
jgi:hypothetical protein